jgi:hypothetical protein
MHTTAEIQRIDIPLYEKSLDGRATLIKNQIKQINIRLTGAARIAYI